MFDFVLCCLILFYVVLLCLMLFNVVFVGLLALLFCRGACGATGMPSPARPSLKWTRAVVPRGARRNCGEGMCVCPKNKYFIASMHLKDV